MRSMMRTKKALFFAIGLAYLLSSCSSIGVKPWERDILARNSMQLDSSPNITAFHEHVYFSKEGSSGGRTFDGGGCGCN